MANHPENPSARPIDEVAAGTSRVSASTTEPIPGALPQVHAPVSPDDVVVDWRTIDPSTIGGEGILVEELRTYREKLDEMMRLGAGEYVLIVGREVISYFKDLEAAASHAERFFRGRTLLIKKVAATEPVHNAGGVVG